MNNRSRNSSAAKPVIITAIVCATVIVLIIAIFLYFMITNESVRSAGRDGDDIDDDVTTEKIAEQYAYPGDLNNPDSRLQSFDWLSDTRLTIDDITGLSGDDLRLLRNAIFAKHGYRFKSADLDRYFSRFSWYAPTHSDVTRFLSPNESYNIEFIRKYEGKGTKGIKSSARVKDVTFANDYSDIVCYSRLTDADVAGLSKSEIRILRNTIYARHGRSFKSSDLNNYFRGFSWYNPYRSEVPPSELSAIEKHNINLLSKYE